MTCNNNFNKFYPLDLPQVWPLPMSQLLGPLIMRAVLVCSPVFCNSAGPLGSLFTLARVVFLTSDMILSFLCLKLLSVKLLLVENQSLGPRMERRAIESWYILAVDMDF